MVIDEPNRRPWLTWERTKDVIAVLTPVAVALLGGMQWYLGQELAMQKASLEQRVGRTNLIDQMLNNIENYLDKSDLPASAKARIIISLLKISTDAYLSTEGQLDQKQEDFVRKIPLYFALLSNDHDMLADIGAQEQEIVLWVPFARRTGDQEVKMTALRALNQIMTTSDSLVLKKEVSRSLLGMEIAPDNAELRASLLDSVVGAIARIDVGEGLGDEDLKDLAGRLRILEDDLRLPRLGPQGDAILGSATGDGRPVEDDEMRARAANVIENLLPPPPPGEVGERVTRLIDQLEGEQRRAARSELARIGAPAVVELVEVLTTPTASYRTQLGAVAALALMAPSSVMLPSEGTEAVVLLLGHSDATMRTTAASFLNSLADPTTLRHAKDQLLGGVEALGNGNLVYNSVTVLGSWLRRSDLDPSFRSEVRSGMVDLKNHLALVEGWQKTRSLLESYLSGN